MRRVSYLLIVSVMVCAAAGAAELRRVAPAAGDAPSVEVETLWTAAPAERSTAKAEAESLHAWLVAERVAQGVRDPLDLTPSAEELAGIELEVCEGCGEEPGRLRVGVAKEVLVQVAGNDLRWGAMKKTDDGGRVWSAAVRSAGASGLRLHFDFVWLPENAALYLYNDAGEAYGPYSGAGPQDSGEFWSPTVGGELIYLQLRVWGPAAPQTLREAYFDLVGLGHLGARFGGLLAGESAKSLCSYNAACVENPECVDPSPAVDAARYAVGRMQFVDGIYMYACSGGLVNTTAADQTPYFITANHCLSTASVASTLEAYFQWWVPCGSTCPSQWQDPVGPPRTYGATLVKTNPTSDYTLLKLSQPAPAGSAFLGWTSTPVAFTNNTLLYRISHPKNGPQAYSENRVDTGAPTCGSWPRGRWIYSRDLLGATEGGSSGSPVVNAQGLLVGQLSGACGMNPSDPCDDLRNATVDGALASYFAEVAPWLDPPPPSCPDADGDGHQAAACGGDDCNDSNPAVYPGAAEVCDNGIDDDCDGGIDEGCPVCDVDGDGFDGFQCSGGSDCDDTRADVYPGAPELCDGIDNDCDGTADEGCATCDADRDGFLADTSLCGGSDCDDANPLVFPGAGETCDNGTDDDCDGLIDEADPECAICEPRKAACTSNDECCSGRCHPKKKACL